MRIKQQPLLAHLKKEPLKQISLLILLSLLYAVLFFSTYNFFQYTILTNFSFLLLIPLSWKYGLRAGFSLLVLNTLWTYIVMRNITPDKITFISPGAIISTLSSVIMVVLSSIAGAYDKMLKKEIKERKKAESRLLKHQNELQDEIDIRTRELEKTFKKIHRNEKLEAVGQLAGGVAHDFNNKLTIMLGYCELLMKHLDKESKLYKYAEQIQISGLHSSELTKQLLAFARKGTYKSQVININEVVSEVIALLARNIPENITLSHSLKSQKPFVWGGASQIQIAILNLAINAREAMTKEGVLSIETTDITIDEHFRKTCDVICEDGHYTAIKISDSGSGISPDIRRHIFEPFFTTKKDGKGTGMGLAAVYGIIKSHKGAITVDTVPGEGSIFTLFFPQTKKKAGTTSAIIRNELSSHNEHIFVIDDEILVAETIKTMLENIGYRVSLAFSGTEAIRIYQEKYKTIDAVILDMSMPEMTGLETFRELKSINPDIIAILTSGYSPNTQIERSMEEGILGFLQKPCDRFEIHILIQKALGIKMLNPKNKLRADQ